MTPNMSNNFCRTCGCHFPPDESERACRTWEECMEAQEPRIDAPSEKEERIARHFEALDWLEDTRRELTALREAVKKIYFAAYWHADRPVNESELWTAVRDAAKLEPGQTGAILGPDRSAQSASAAPMGHDEAHARINECFREIEIICDSFGYDPAQWLVLGDDDLAPLDGSNKR